MSPEPEKDYGHGVNCICKFCIYCNLEDLVKEGKAVFVGVAEDGDPMYRLADDYKEQLRQGDA